MVGHGLRNFVWLVKSYTLKTFALHVPLYLEFFLDKQEKEKV